MIEFFGIGVSRSPRGRLLDQVCATFDGGELVIVSGEADARQALLDVVTAREVPPEGRLWVDRVPLMTQTLRRIRAAVGDVDLGEELPGHRSVLRTVMTHRTPADGLRRLLVLPRRRERDTAVAALDAVGLGDRAQESVALLTPVERVRAQLARAIARGCRHLVVRDLDGTLPPHDTLGVLVLLRSLTRHDRRVVIVSLDEPTLATSLADRFLALSDGRLQHDEPPAPGEVRRHLAVVRR